MKIGPITSRKMMDMLENIALDLKDIKKDVKDVKKEIKTIKAEQEELRKAA